MATHSAQEIPLTEKSGVLTWGHKESDMTEYTRSQKFGTRLLLYKHKFLLCTAL